MPIYPVIECLKEIEKKPNTEVKLPASGADIAQVDGNVAIPSDVQSKIPLYHHGTYVYTAFMCILMLVSFVKAFNY